MRNTPNAVYKSLMDKCNKQNFPIRCIFELTYKCNLRCRHCFQTDHHSQPLNTGQIKNILKDIAHNGTFDISFTGGEVFMRQDIFDIFEAAHREKFIISVFTNGTLITEKMAKRLKGYSIKNVNMSIYGPTSDLHDKITGVKGSFNALINAIRFLRSYKIPVILKAKIFKDTFNSYRELKKLAEALDVTIYSFSHMIIPMKDGSRKNRYMSIHGKDLSDYFALMNEDGVFTKMKNNKFIPRQKAQPVKAGMNGAGSGFAQANPAIKDAMAVKPRSFTDAKGAMPELNVCSAAHNTFGINPYGELMPCILSQVSAGSLLKASLKDLWYNSSVLKEWREIKLKDIYKCNKCKLRIICAICPAAQLLENRAFKPVKAMCESAYLTDKYIKEVQNDKAHKEDRKASQEALCEACC